MSLPVDDPLCTQPALVNAIFLWALRFSQRPQLMQLDSIYLGRTIAALPTSLGIQNARTVIQTIQAEILVSQHLYRSNRLLEGKYHADAAMSLTLGNQLHMIDANSPSRPDLGGITREEVIRIFWTAFTLDKCWSVVLGTSPVFPEDYFSSSVSTPLPLRSDGATTLVRHTSSWQQTF